MSYRDDVLVALVWLEEQDSNHARVIEGEITRLRSVLTTLEESWSIIKNTTDEFLKEYENMKLDDPRVADATNV